MYCICVLSEVAYGIYKNQESKGASALVMPFISSRDMQNILVLRMLMIF